MAGFFGFFDFTKPGPGVPKPDEAHPKNGIRIFFEVLQRKFWKIIRVGMLFFLMNIPAYLAAIFVANYFSFQLLGEIGEPLEILMVLLASAALLTGLPIITIGPVRAGMETVFRNYSREEHSFIWSDFKDSMKANMKQGLIMSLINLIFFIIIAFDLILIRFMAFNSEIMFILFNAGFILLFVIYLMMNIYIYPLMVTFELNIRNIIKNAFLFAMLRFIPNLLILIIIFVLLLLPFNYLNPIFALIISFLLIYGIIGFLASFYAQRGFRKYIMKKIREKENSKAAE